jgi:hypothetical protein
MALPDGPEPAPPLRNPAGADAFDRSVEFLGIAAQLRASMTGPTVLVIDDFQWADDDTRALITHLCRVLADRPLLWVVTSRTRTGPLSAAIESFSRLINTDHRELGGLDTRSIRQILRSGGVDADDELAGAVRARTGGNPFYIEELSALIEVDGRLATAEVPESIRQWMRHRLRGLAEPSARVLGAAAVMGTEIDVDLLCEVIDATPWEVLDACDRLLDDRWLDEHPDGTLAFRHALTREAVVSTLGASRLAVLHAKVAAGLERRPGTSAAALAAHLASAGPGTTDRANAAALAAGDDALGHSAWSTAADWYERVIESSPSDPETMLRALIGSGRARRGAGDRTGARIRLERARQLAITVGDGRACASATLSLVGGGARGVSDLLPDAERSELLRRAIAMLSPDDHDLRIRLQLELALSLVLTEHVTERNRLVGEAFDRATELARPDLLVEASLGQRMAMTAAECDVDRVRITDEAVDRSRSIGRNEMLLAALMARCEDALLLGDRALADELLREACELATRHDHPYWKWVTATWGVLSTIIDGDLDTAEVAAFAALELQSAHPEAMACLGVNLVDIRLFQGRSGEMVDLLRAEADANPHIPCYRAVLALCLAESGDLVAARQEYEHFAANRFSDIPDDSNRLLTLVVLADVAATLVDPVGAGILLDLLEPHQDRQALLNCFGGGGAYWGPVTMHLARLAAVTGDSRMADWREAAQRSCQQVRAPAAASRLGRGISVG